VRASVSRCLELCVVIYRGTACREVEGNGCGANARLASANSDDPRCTETFFGRATMPHDGLNAHKWRLIGMDNWTSVPLVGLLTILSNPQIVAARSRMVAKPQ
jgi:hypothetical protein